MRRRCIRMRENGSGLDFNFISLPSPMIDENWVFTDISYAAQFSFVNKAMYDWNYLWMANQPNVSTFFVYG